MQGEKSKDNIGKKKTSVERVRNLLPKVKKN